MWISRKKQSKKILPEVTSFKNIICSTFNEKDLFVVIKVCLFSLYQM